MKKFGLDADAVVHAVTSLVKNMKNIGHLIWEP